MNLENVRQVKARIAQIRKRFPEIDMPARPVNSHTRTFGSVLEQVGRSRPMPCPDDLEPIICGAAEKNGLDPNVIKAVIRAESGFNADAVSRAGARGLMQLMPSTAMSLGVDPTDPEQAINGGARYLRQQLDRFGSLELALAAYNAGPGAVQRYGGVPPYSETQDYIRKVLQYAVDYSNSE